MEMTDLTFEHFKFFSVNIFRLLSAAQCTYSVFAFHNWPVQRHTHAYHSTLYTAVRMNYVCVYSFDLQATCVYYLKTLNTLLKKLNDWKKMYMSHCCRRGDITNSRRSKSRTARSYENRWRRCRCWREKLHKNSTQTHAHTQTPISRSSSGNSNSSKERRVDASVEGRKKKCGRLNKKSCKWICCEHRESERERECV